MDSISREDLQNILEPSFRHAENIEILETAEGGHDYQYTSSITQVAIQYNQEGKRHEKHLAIKIPKNNAVCTEFFETMNFYARENYMYKILIPELQNFLDEPIIPVCYHTTDSRILVMENILSQGYESGIRRQFLNLQQSFRILEALSQFHAASHKVCQATPSLLDDLLFETSILIVTKHLIIDPWKPILCELLKMKNANHLVEKLNAALEYLRQSELAPKLGHSNFKFNVLNHGDFRITNLMLKFNAEDRRVEQVKLIDFQTCKWTTPALDLVYFFTSSVQVDVIQDHFEALINWYLQCLNEKLEKLNCSDTYNKQNFMADFQTLGFFQLLCAVCLGSLVSPLDREQLDNIPLLDEKGKEDMCQRCLNDEKWAHTMFGWLDFCHKLNIIDALSDMPT